MPETCYAETEDGLERPEASLPLQIKVTAVGRAFTGVHDLLRRCVPIVETPGAYPEVYRMEMARRMKELLEATPESEEDTDSEPGHWFDADEEDAPWPCA